MANIFIQGFDSEYLGQSTGIESLAVEFDKIKDNLIK